MPASSTTTSRPRCGSRSITWSPWGTDTSGTCQPMPSQESQHGPTMRALRAYANACTELDLPRLDYHADHDLRHIRLMTTNLLQEHPEITALVTMREMVETALFSAVHDAGLRVPDDISVLGLTTPQGPELTSPALTAMEFPAWSMAYEAGRMMIDELEGVDTTVQGDPLGSDPDRACEHEPGASAAGSGGRTARPLTRSSATRSHGSSRRSCRRRTKTTVTIHRDPARREDMMFRDRRRVRAVLMSAVAALVVVGCGDDDSAESPTETTGTRTALPLRRHRVVEHRDHRRGIH